MKRTIKQAGIMLFIISCILFTQGCSSEVPTQVQTDSENILSTNEQEDHETGNSFSEDASKGNEASNETENNFSKDAQMDTNRERFYEKQTVRALTARMRKHTCRRFLKMMSFRTASWSLPDFS